VPSLSALDARSEAELVQTLEDLLKQMGILLIAHRLSAVQTADCVCVIEAVRMIESGSWSELMARRAWLFAQAEAQSLVTAQPAAGEPPAQAF
jgi:ABC-type multidrug transport system fused ATPase/permease subunit